MWEKHRLKQCYNDRIALWGVTCNICVLCMHGDHTLQNQNCIHREVEEFWTTSFSLCSNLTTNTRKHYVQAYSKGGMQICYKNSKSIALPHAVLCSYLKLSAWHSALMLYMLTECSTSPHVILTIMTLCLVLYCKRERFTGLNLTFLRFSGVSWTVA